MTERAQELAGELDVVVAGFRELVESLTDEQWRRTGRNHPTIRIGDEDEGRPVGVIAFHTAAAMARVADWMGKLVDGEPIPPFDRSRNAQQAQEHAGVSRAEVVATIDAGAPVLRAFVGGLTDAQLDRTIRTMAGESTVAEAVRRVAIGHVLWHRGSIEATIAP